MTTVLIPRELAPGETRVAAVPETVRRLVKDGFEVALERGAGEGAGIDDAAFEEAGATVGADLGALYDKADVVLKVNPPTCEAPGGRQEAALLSRGTLLVSFLWPRAHPEAMRTLRDRGVSAFAMELIPRITRAQSMDALSSQSNIAGYKAALLAADALPKLFPLLMTAAGTIRPARVVVLGAGVAGLQAIATARRLGAVVEVSDVRQAVKEQVESLGARFLVVEGAEDLEGEGGYAREASREFLERQQALVQKHIVAADAVITTALVPGRPAPRLITAEMVRQMRRGSVIVDLAVEQGGNCELSVPGEVVVREGVTLIGHRNLPGRVPVHASEVYARNLLHVVHHLHQGSERRLDFEDEITAASVVIHDGKVRPQDLADELERGSAQSAAG
jgi:NAD(P) transhydrogenase subunit alpha